MHRAETLGYAIAVVILVIGGALLRTPILNWIAGPAIVIGSVAATTWWASRRAGAEPTDDATTVEPPR